MTELPVYAYFSGLETMVDGLRPTRKLIQAVAKLTGNGRPTCGEFCASRSGIGWHEEKR